VRPFLSSLFPPKPNYTGKRDRRIIVHLQPDKKVSENLSEKAR
jgi:hypothetical protein